MNIPNAYTLCESCRTHMPVYVCDGHKCHPKIKHIAGCGYCGGDCYLTSDPSHALSQKMMRLPRHG